MPYLFMREPLLPERTSLTAMGGIAQIRPDTNKRHPCDDVGEKE
jgi:hypothetical protein